MDSKWKMVKAIAIPLIGGTIVGTIATRNAKEKYNKLDTPKFAPPGWVYPVAWTSLYTLMGIAKYNYDRKPKAADLQARVDRIYATQLAFNFLWSFLFFRWNKRGTALVDASLLLSIVVWNTNSFYKKSKLAGSLMLPYIGWSSYAVALNYAIWSRNRQK